MRTDLLQSLVMMAFSHHRAPQDVQNSIDDEELIRLVQLAAKQGPKLVRSGVLCFKCTFHPPGALFALVGSSSWQPPVCGFCCTGEIIE